VNDIQALIKKVRGGVFNICALESGTSTVIGTGSGFWAHGHLITNHHVMHVKSGCDVWIRRDDDDKPDSTGLRITHKDWLSRIVTSSATDSYDYAIMRCPELADVGGLYNFTVRDPSPLEPGAAVVFSVPLWSIPISLATQTSSLRSIEANRLI
jgi:hypothetical protein